VRSDAVFPAIKGYTPPSDMGPVFKETYDEWTQAVKDKATVKAFAWETGGDALLPGVDAKVFAATQDVILGRKSPEAAAAYLDDEWKKAS